MKEIRPKRIAILFFLSMCSLILSCNTDNSNNYDGKEELTLIELVKREIKNGVKNDSLIIGLQLGMTPSQVDSVFKKAVKDSLLTRKKTGLEYTIKRFDVLDKLHEHKCIITAIGDDLTPKLIGVNLYFLDDDYKGLMFLFEEKYGAVKYHTEENYEVRDIYLSQGKVIEFKTDKLIQVKYNVAYTDINYFMKELETIEKEEKLEMEKKIQEREQKEKSAKVGTKAI